ncbi:unnamed protein product [Lymnaea stagnalis]|uniref:Saposin B-type domain-containing protein n=1 Tax=Lymnaea stagnalis TaxID=6523 RepID=A0AAV2H8D4_LYMST
MTTFPDNCAQGSELHIRKMKKTFLLPCIIYYLTVTASSNEDIKDLNFFDDVPTELRCSGCQLTVKVLNGILLRNKEGPIEKRVQNAMKKLCQESKMTISEYNPKLVTKVCKFITDKHQLEVTDELIKHYGQERHPTYLELSHRICLEVLHLCAGSSDSHKEEETLLQFNGMSQDFTIKPGDNIKIAQPVGEKFHQEL